MNQSGFTLIELLVVIIIVAVLAAVGLPLLQGNIARARLSEVDASLGTIRTNLRAYLAEFGKYPDITAGSAVVGKVAGVSKGDLTGRWWDDDDFKITSSSTPTATALSGPYCIAVKGDGDTGNAVDIAPKAAQVKDVLRAMDQDGNIYLEDNCTESTTNKIIN
ncbi:MAG: type II secretion system protein [Candidatus Aenigmarchaeota archaeon]|nr:type II secretion system protein [Candidatus Aenigmarchaeota archaeon]